MNISKRKAFILLSMTVVSWGLTWVAAKIIVREITPVWFSAFRYLIVLGVTGLLLLAAGRMTLPRKGDLLVILVVGLFSMTCCSVFMAAGVQFVPVGRSVVLGYTSPLWVTPGAWLFLREPLPKRRLIGIVLGIIGIIILCDPQAMLAGQGFAPLGYLFLLLNALSFAVAILYIRKHTWVATPFQNLFWQALLASILLNIMALVLEGRPDFSPSPLTVLALLHCSIPGAVLAFWAMNVVNSCLPATTTSLCVLATPVFGIIFSTMFLGEQIDLSLIIAVFLILGGIALGTIKT
ncbi:MAG: DMT family transporter [Deltaproteobacteria bacterium]|jgi:drug/metabolite transporter (DMT)-like permease|nr:DMT family transporter [Deltaproteobacteria bacterium]